jgi:hypothetical protein
MTNPIDPLKLDPKFESAVQKMLFSQTALQLVRDGAISTKGKTDEEIEKEVLSFLKKNLQKQRVVWSVRITHEEVLLREARRHSRSRDAEFAALFFATYFEHKLNWLVAQICEKKRIDDSTITLVLREASLRAKCTWLLRLLGHDPIKTEIAKRLTI